MSNSRTARRRADLRPRRQQQQSAPQIAEVLEDKTLLSADGLVELPAETSGVSGLLLDHAAREQARVVDGPVGDTAPNDLLTFDGQGRVGIRLTATNVDALADELSSLNFVETARFSDLHFLEGFITAESLTELAGLSADGLLGVTPIYRPGSEVGSVTSQADVVHESDRVRGTSPTGYNGTGLTIGVLSDSYNNLGGAAADISSGDLPAGGVNVLLDLGSGGSDEGRAMLQLIHDVAPGADFAFASAYFGEASFAQQIRNLADDAQGNADVIVDDVVYLSEPFFQDGVVAQAVDDVVTNDGVTYFSSAGNRSTQAYESTTINFAADSGGLAGSYYDFDTGAGTDVRQLITVNNGQQFRPSMQWDDPFYTVDGVDTNLDIFLVAAGTTTVVASSTTNNLANQTPAELLTFTNDTGVTGTTQFEVLIRRTAGPDPGRIKYVNFGSDVTINEFDTDSPTVNPHSAATNAMAVAAVFYGAQNVPESFTSEGPSTILFEADGTPLGSPEVRQTPRIAAVDGADTTFFGSSDSEGNGFPNFFGTSAAAPHAAAVAALIQQANPGFTPDQIYDRLESTATDIGGDGYDNITGYGLINAYDAIFGPAVATTLNVADGFEDGVLSAAWETHSTGPGRILVTGDNGPNSGSAHLIMDTFASFGDGLNEAILHVNANGYTDLALSFDFKESGDENHPMSSSFTGSENSDGVALSVDGINWYEIIELTDTAGNAPESYTTFGPIDLSAIAATNTLTLGSDVRIKFQQFDNFPYGSDGFAFDNIVVTGQSSLASTTIVSVDGSGNLVITDAENDDTDDGLTIQSDTVNNQFIINDPDNEIGTIVDGATGSETNTVYVPFSSVTGAQILVNTAGGDDTLTVDFSLGNFSKQISFDGGAQVTGDALDLTGGSFADAAFGFTNSSTGTVDLTGNSQISYTGLEPIDADITAANVTLNYGATGETIAVSDAGSGRTTVTSTAGETLTFDNPTGTLTVNAGAGDDTVNLTSLATNFAAHLAVNGQGDTDSVQVNSALTFADDKNLSVTAETIGLNTASINTPSSGSGSQIYDGAVTLGNSVAITTGDLTFGGTVNLASFQLTLDVSGTGSADGAVSGTGSLVKQGLGTLALPTSNSYTGTTTIEAGTLAVNASHTSAVILAGGTVEGTGTLAGGLTAAASGGNIAPGSSPGRLSVGNGVTFNGNTTYQAELDGTSAGTSYDQLDVTGAVDLASAVLSLSVGFTPALSDTFVIINNDEADAVTGTFAGLAEGAAITTDSGSFTISYVGGDGNDVVLTATAQQFVVDSTEDTDDGIYTTGELTLREAIRIAENLPGAAQISFDASLAGQTITLGGTQLPTVTDELQITGLGARQLTIDAGGLSRILELEGGSNVTLSGLTLTGGGNVDSGGAILSSADSLTVSDSQFLSNNATTIGGALRLSAGQTVISGSTFSGNSADLGGAVYSFDTLTVVNSTFSGNSATDSGGAINNQNGTTVIGTSTFTANRADSDDVNGGTGGGLWTYNDEFTFTTTYNTIVAGNFVGSGDVADDINGKSLEAASTYNLIGDAGTAGGLTGGVDGNIVGAVAAEILDPNLHDNGGETDTHALLSTGAAVNAGNNAAALDAEAVPLTTDQRGTGFDRIVGGTVDIGAFESGAGALAEIGNFIWSDVNRNGAQDAGEKGVRISGGVTIRLVSPGNDGIIGGTDDFVFATTATNKFGVYKFQNVLPRDYYLEVDLPADYAFTTQYASTWKLDSDADSTTGRTDIFSAVGGETDYTRDIGMLEPGRVGDRVWIDDNANGQLDSGELGIRISGGMTVNLWDAGADEAVGGGDDTQVATTQTNKWGIYLFEGVDAGRYFVEFILPDGYEFTVQNAASWKRDSDPDTATGMTDAFNLTANKSDYSRDAGLMETVVPPAATNAVPPTPKPAKTVEPVETSSVGITPDATLDELLVLLFDDDPDTSAASPSPETDDPVLTALDELLSLPLNLGDPENSLL